MTKRWRIKKEYLNDSGHFWTGQGVPEDGEVANPATEPAPVQVPQANKFLPDFFGGAREALSSQIAAGNIVPGQPELNRMAQPPEPQPQAKLPTTQASSPMQASAPQVPANPYMGEAMVQGQIADEQAMKHEQYQQRMARAQSVASTEQNSINAERDELSKKMSDPIDPGRYWNSMSTGGRLSTAIGLILGGLGGGLNKTGRNTVQEFLDKRIEDDLNAQKADKTNQGTLLADLTRRYGDSNTALQMARVGLNDKLASEVTQAALKHGGELAKQRAMQFAAQIQQQNQALMQPLIKQRVTHDAIRQGATAEQLLDMGADHKLISEQYVPGMGLAGNAKDAEELKKMSATMTPLISNVKQLSALGPSAMVPGTPANKRASALMGQIVLDVKSDQVGALGVLSGPDMGLIQDMMQDKRALGSIFSGDVKNNQLLQFLENKIQAQTKSRLAVPIGGQQTQQAPASQIQFKPRK